MSIADALTYHCLDHPYVAIQRTAEKAAGKSHEVVGAKSDNEKGKYGTNAAHDQHGLTPQPVRETSPVPVQLVSVCLSQEPGVQ